MSPILVFSIIFFYFLALITIAYFTGKKSSSQDFLTASKQSPWYLVAYGMIGASLSGVTFISIPGAVLNNQFTYLSIATGYIVGYLFNAWVLLPIYYKMNLVSIYTYLETRFGFYTYQTGAFFFLLSRTLGSGLRLFLAVVVLQVGLFGAWGFPFWLTAVVSVALIWVYTFQGGIKTIIWTDTFQSTFLLLALIFSLYFMASELNFGFFETFSKVYQSDYTTMFYWDILPKNNFFKNFIGGIFIAIAMTGLDQDMMQKNLTCSNLKEAQKNIYIFTIILWFVHLIFLTMGVLLYLYAKEKGIALPMKDGKILTDQVYPFLAFNHFSVLAGVMFLLGITASTYASSDSALTSLTTSFSVDILGLEKSNLNEKQRKTLLTIVHIGFSVLLILLVLVFKFIQDTYPNTNVITNLFTLAGFTYGPLLGLYFFGIFTKYEIYEKFTPLVCVLAPMLAYILQQYSPVWFWGYQIGFEILLFNGIFTFCGLWLLVKKAPQLPK